MHVLHHVYAGWHYYNLRFPNKANCTGLCHTVSHLHIFWSAQVHSSLWFLICKQWQLHTWMPSRQVGQPQSSVLRLQPQDLAPLCITDLHEQNRANHEHQKIIIYICIYIYIYIYIYIIYTHTRTQWVICGRWGLRDRIRCKCMQTQTQTIESWYSDQLLRCTDRDQDNAFSTEKDVTTEVCRTHVLNLCKFAIVSFCQGRCDRWCDIYTWIFKTQFLIDIYKLSTFGAVNRACAINLVKYVDSDRGMDQDTRTQI